MVTWNYYKARRIKDVDKFLKNNECYDYKRFCDVLKAKEIIPPSEESLEDTLPAEPLPPRRKPKPAYSRLGIKKTPAVSIAEPKKDETKQRKAVAKKQKDPAEENEKSKKAKR